jgi:hypothetical protein
VRNSCHRNSPFMAVGGSCQGESWQAQFGSGVFAPELEAREEIRSLFSGRNSKLKADDKCGQLPVVELDWLGCQFDMSRDYDFPMPVGKPARGLSEPRHLDRGRGNSSILGDLPFPCLRSFSSFLFARCVDLCGPVARRLLVDLAGAAAPALFGKVA